MPTITFRRDANITSASIPVVDGQILFDTATHQLFMDSGSERYQYGGSVEIVSTTPAARADNVYSALASNQIFLQKTTIIDSKSNALAVTQQYIPLGCLAFKETIGTTNFSSVGSTVSSALVALGNRATTVEGKVSTIENELTANNRRIYMDYQGGKYGYNTSANRGADTFHPFKNAADIITDLPSFLSTGCTHGDGFAYGTASMSIIAQFNGSVSVSGDGRVRKNSGSDSSSVSFVEGDILTFSILKSVQSGQSGSATTYITWTAL